MVIGKDKLNVLYSAKNMLINCHDDYNVGMYNGIEYCISAIEGRKPEYFIASEENKEEQGQYRTLFSGIKRG